MQAATAPIARLQAKKADYEAALEAAVVEGSPTKVLHASILACDHDIAREQQAEQERAQADLEAHQAKAAAGARPETQAAVGRVLDRVRRGPIAEPVMNRSLLEDAAFQVCLAQQEVEQATAGLQAEKERHNLIGLQFAVARPDLIDLRITGEREAGKRLPEHAGDLRIAEIDGKIARRLKAEAAAQIAPFQRRVDEAHANLANVVGKLADEENAAVKDLTMQRATVLVGALLAEIAEIEVFEGFRDWAKGPRRMNVVGRYLWDCGFDLSQLILRRATYFKHR